MVRFYVFKLGPGDAPQRCILPDDNPHSITHADSHDPNTYRLPDHDIEISAAIHDERWLYYMFIPAGSVRNGRMYSSDTLGCELLK